MTDSTEMPRRSPYAVPLDRFLGDGRVDTGQLVVEQPCSPSPVAPAVAAPDGDGD